jgi:aryl-alcohol dehydrogenase-like predicted oxidoreductase
MNPAEMGQATPAGTTRLAARSPGAGFYRPAWDGLTTASIGLGTYLGEPDTATDAGYEAAVRRYLQLGGNLLDSAINYRFQRSERSVGAALQAALAAGEVRRDEVVLCTKGGFLSFDGGWPAEPEAWVKATFIDTGLVQPDEIVDGHCMAPAYLRHQIARSRENMQTACIDLYYLHNPEGQRAAVGETEFDRRLREAFAALEVAVAQGHIGAYGTATWNGYRVPPEAPNYLSLQRVLAAAREVSGERHHLRAVQLPLNFQMVETIGRANQPASTGMAPLLQAAAEHQVTVVTSAPMLQGRVLGRLPASLRAKFPADLTDAQRALQFARSAPGVTAALAGMSTAAHVDENLRLRDIAPMSPAEFSAVFES